MRRRELLAGLAAAALPLSVGAEPEKTLAEQLGYGKDERLLILHADDVGMCHSVNTATTRALTEGIATCGSVMAPCPWLPEIAAWSREHPDGDLGVHLALTSEWRYYRWRPVSPVEKVPGLVDDEGFLHRTVEAVRKSAKPEEVELEIRAQIARVRQFGIKPTHIDSHMGGLFADPRFFEAYTRVGKETGLMPMVPGPTLEVVFQAKALGIDYPPLVKELKARGFPVLDRLVTGLSGSTLEDRKKSFQALLRDLKPGVTELIVHLAGDDPEIRNISGAWQARHNDFQVMTDADCRKMVEDAGVKRIGYRALEKAWAPGK